jgi:hypothetical protein
MKLWARSSRAVSTSCQAQTILAGIESRTCNGNASDN